jgi:hypothetical protein
MSVETSDAHWRRYRHGAVEGGPITVPGAGDRLGVGDAVARLPRVRAPDTVVRLGSVNERRLRALYQDRSPGVPRRRRVHATGRGDSAAPGYRVECGVDAESR